MLANHSNKIKDDLKQYIASCSMDIEQYLASCPDEAFPKYDPARGEIPYPERYRLLKNALIPLHSKAEKDALSVSAIKWKDKAIKIIQDIDDLDERNGKLKQLDESDTIAYLNNHGPGHVNAVCAKLSKLILFFDHKYILTEYEIFLLLCAIQVHDIGNIFGREGHEKHCRQILDEKGKPFIPDSFERQLIAKIAMVHGGSIDGDQNMIDYLTENKPMFDHNVRKHLLAALLRFCDELADDSSRADREGLKLGTIPEECLIYHHYSYALHTVKVERGNNKKITIFLAFEFDSDLAAKKFIKNGKKKYLLDEIYDRTLKMERERRYCMRFIRPCFSVESIRVEITIQNSIQLLRRDIIQYSLRENGYPHLPPPGTIQELIPEIRTGNDEIKYLKREWKL